MCKILIISENAEVSSAVEKILHDAEYQASKYQNSRPGYEISHNATLIIFDTTPYKQDAATVFAQFKTHNPLIPSIALTEPKNVKMAVQIMQNGAISVLALPISHQDLLREVERGIAAHTDLHHSEAVLQQVMELLQSLNIGSRPLSEQSQQTSTQPSGDKMLELGELHIHIQQAKASYRGVPIDLTPTQFKLLAYLGEAKGHIVSFEELYFHLHDTRLSRSAARTALSAHMSYLRSKLDEVGCDEYLTNIRGRGYLLNVPEKKASRSDQVNLDLMLGQLPIILWSTNDLLEITSIVGAGLNKLNLQPERGISRPSSEIFQTVSDAHAQVLKGQSISYEEHIESRVFELHIEPLYNNDGAIEGCIGLGIDITEKKDLEEAYERLIHYSLQGLAIFQDNRIVFANPALEQITGYTSAELLAYDQPTLLVHEDDRFQLEENMQACLSGDCGLSQCEFRFIAKNGSVTWVKSNFYLIAYQDQIALQMIVIGQA